MPALLRRQPIAISAALILFTIGSEFLIRVSSAAYVLVLVGLVLIAGALLYFLVIILGRPSGMLPLALAIGLLLVFLANLPSVAVINDRLYFALNSDFYRREVAERDGLWAGDEWDGGSGWTKFIAYDASGQLARPDNERTETWEREWTLATGGRIPPQCRLSARRIEQHFYVVTANC